MFCQLFDPCKASDSHVCLVYYWAILKYFYSVQQVRETLRALKFDQSRVKNHLGNLTREKENFFLSQTSTLRYPDNISNGS